MTNAPGGTDRLPADRVEVFPMAVGSYDAHEPLPVDPEVRAVMSAMADFNAVEVPWTVSMHDRGGDGVDERLRDWSEPARPTDTILYWVGHGWSDGLDVSLAHARSPAAVRTSGVLPQRMAEALRARQATSEGHWALVVIETCWSSRFVDRVNAFLSEGPMGADGVLLVGVSGDGGTALGRFSQALRGCLEENFRSNRRIELWSLAGELDRRLPGGLVVSRRLRDTALVRPTTPLASHLAVPLDILEVLEQAVNRLSEDERRHFLVKAQGAEEGELSWYFEGRELENTALAGWLRAGSSGLFVVTGAAGAGKSALLGHALVSSLPDLRDTLVRAGLVEPVAVTARPPDHAFHGVVHLSGLSMATLIARIADAAGVGPPPSAADEDSVTSIGADVSWLLKEVAQLGRPLTLLLDALDEAQDPVTVAGTVLRALSRIPGVRLVVGTRASTLESPDHSAGDDTNLLQALGVGTHGAAIHVLRVDRDDSAVTRYVAKRLRAAREQGRLEASDSDVVRAANEVASKRRHFLFARLAVYELIARPSLLEPARQDHLRRLLRGDHRDLFRTAMDRLAEGSGAFPALIEALALAHGKGLPVRDGIWATVGNALHDHRGGPISDRDISDLLRQAQPYVTVDEFNAVTVYRLAHRTFTEHFLADGRSLLRRQRNAALALIAAAARSTGALNPYLADHLAAHVADGEAWRSLAAEPDVLDRLHPGAVTADALRSVFMSETVPPEIAGVVTAHHALTQAASPDVAGIRQLGTATVQGVFAGGGPPTRDRPWAVRWAVLPGQQLHVTIPAHQGFVNHVCQVDAGDGRTLIASGGDDFLVRLWDPFTAAPVGEPMRGHTGTVEAVCAVSLPGGRAGVASSGSDGAIFVWDVTTGEAYAAGLFGHHGTVRSLCAVADPDGGSWLVSAGYDGTVRRWDLVRPGAAPLVLDGHRGPVVTLAPSTSDAHRPLVYSAGVDGTVRGWDVRAGAALAGPVARRRSGLRSLCVLRDDDDRELVAFAGYDGHIEFASVADDGPVPGPLRGHHGAVWGLTSWGRGSATRILSSGDDATVREWFPLRDEPSGRTFVGHVGTVVSTCTPTTPGGAILVASGGSDGTIRLWSPDRPGTGSGELHRPSPLRGVCAVPGSGDDEPRLATATLSGDVAFWHIGTGRLLLEARQVSASPVWCVRAMPGGSGYALALGTDDGGILLIDAAGRLAASLAVHDGPVRGLAVARHDGGGWLLASVGDDCTLRLWDVARQRPYSGPLRAHPGVGTFCDVAFLRGPEGRALLAACADDGSVQFWDVLARRPIGEPGRGHVGPAMSLSVVAPQAGSGAVVVSGGVDAMLVLREPGESELTLSWSSGHTGGIRAVEVVNDTTDAVDVVSAGADGQVLRHRLRRPSDTRSWTVLDTATLDGGSGGGMRALARVASPPSDSVVAVGDLGEVLMWDAATAHRRGEPFLTGSAAQARVAWLSHHGKPYCVCLGADGTLRAWEMGASVTARRERIEGGAFSALDAAGESVAVTGDGDGTLRLWRGAQLEPVVAMSLVARRPVLDVCWLDGSVVSVVTDGSLEVVDVRLGRVLATVSVDGFGAVSSQCRVVGRDGSISLLVGTRTGWTTLINPLGGDVLERRRLVPGAAVTSVATMPATGGTAGTVLLAASRDGAVDVWRPHGERRRLRVGGGPLSALCTPAIEAAPVLVTGGRDGVLECWDVPSGVRLLDVPLGSPILSLADATEPGTGAVVAGTGGGVVAVSLDEATLRVTTPVSRGSVRR